MFVIQAQTELNLAHQLATIFYLIPIFPLFVWFGLGLLHFYFAVFSIQHVPA